MATTAEMRQLVCPYLPPDIWNRILLEYAKDTTRTELWTLGRRVCSPWRSEIATVYAEKYLENGNLVQIEPEFCSSAWDSYRFHSQRLTATFVFDRYEGANRRRCIFTEAPDSIKRRDKAYEGTMFATLQQKVELYLGTDSKDGRFDIPPYRVRVGPKVNDTELPGLKYDPQKREISFELEGAFTCFFREAAVMERLECRIKAEAKQWFEDEGDPAKRGTRRLTARALARKHNAARRETAKRIRRSRIKEWYLENHGINFEDDRFDKVAENDALNNIERRQDSRDSTDCTESPEEKLWAKSFGDYWNYVGTIDGSTTDHGSIKVEDVFARSALGKLVWPKPGSDVTEDDMDYDTMVDIYYDATPPYEGPWFDEWGTELDKWGDPLRDGESEEEDDEEDDLDAAGNIHQTENGAPSKVDEPDEWGGLSDWDEEDQIW